MKRRLEGGNGGGEEDEKIEKHDSIFAGPIQLFKNAPVNRTFIDRYEERVYASPPGNTLSDVYTFRHTSQPTGLIRLNHASVSASLQFKNTAGRDLVANQDIVFNGPVPLRTIWKTKELKINHTLVNLASNYENHIANINFLVSEVPRNHNDYQEINLGILDTANHFEHPAGNANDAAPNSIGTGYHTHTDAGLAATLSMTARKRHLLASNTTPTFFTDILDIPLFNDNGSDSYLPSTFDLEIRLTRADMRQIVMGCQLPNAAGNEIENQRLHIKDFTLTLPIYKPNEQLRRAINSSFVDDNKESKFYTVEYRTIVQTIAQGTTNHQATDIFNGHIPTRFYILLLPTANFDGSFTTNCYNYGWHNLNFVSVKKNSNVVHPELENSKQAYKLLQKNLNRQFSEMPFPYKDFENGYAIIMYDLSPNHDSYLQVLPLTTTGNLSVDLKFSDPIIAGGLRVLFIGEFRNQLHLSYQQAPRRIYDF